jgi:hypothetical protein
MTKTLQSNQQSEVDAESVPSSLRIVCDDASSINLQAAEVGRRIRKVPENSTDLLVPQFA